MWFKEHEVRDSDDGEEDECKDNNVTSHLKVPQRKLTFVERIQLIVVSSNALSLTVKSFP